MHSKLRFSLFVTLLGVLCLAGLGTSRLAWAQEKADLPRGHDAAVAHKGAEDADEHNPFKAEHGTWFNPLARAIFGGGTPEESKEHAGEFSNVKYDFVIVEVLAMAALALLFVKAAKGLKVRPEGKAHSLTNSVEAAVEAYRDYLVGIMGHDLAYRYAPLISSFFFTILFFNWMGLVPGLLAPTSNPNIPIGLALVAFVCVHVIAIKESGFKSYIMHFVGEPIWLAPLNFPLHIIGELIKPLSLSLRLLCNVFGEEMVVGQFTVMAIAIFAATHIPIPLQLPFMLLGTFFGFLQALVFSTLLAIYIAVLSTHHDDHDAHNAHGHVEHDVVHGRTQIVGHPSESTLA